MNAPARNVSAAGIVARIWALGVMGLFLLFWIPFSALFLYYLAGVQGVVIAVVISAVIVGWARQGARRSWRCGACKGVMAAGSASCPHCGVMVTPPR